MRPCDRNIKKALRLTDKMILLADMGDAEREDIGCGVLYGIVRDAAYKIQQQAKKEKALHIAKGWWRRD